MKNCLNCGAVNEDENNFCCGCGSTAFTNPSAENLGSPIRAAAPVQNVPYNNNIPTKFDLFTIFGFVASIIGAFVIALILEPLALVSAIIGFVKGKRFRGLAIAAIIIAIIALLIRLFVTLHNLGAIPEWLITGAID
ncbi:MAG: hypothetical protein IJX15_07645 [Ruminiclostridium sp.]|nr:hypothetical protein [Ruminiclostridium sp.]